MTGICSILPPLTAPWTSTISCIPLIPRPALPPANPDYAGDYDENLDRNASQLYDQIVGLYIVPAGSQTDVPTDTAQAIELSAETLELLCGGTATLTADVYPWTLTDQTVTWSSSNEAVATVHDGTVTATGAGTATITATTRAKPNLSASCTITVDRVPDIRFSGLIYGADNIPVWAGLPAAIPEITPLWDKATVMSQAVSWMRPFMSMTT